MNTIERLIVDYSSNKNRNAKEELNKYFRLIFDALNKQDHILDALDTYSNPTVDDIEKELKEM